MNNENLSQAQPDRLSGLRQRYEEKKALNLKLDMSRGKPAPDQFDLLNQLMTNVNQETGYLSEAGVDCRNYGLPDGLPELKKLFADVLGVDPQNVIAGGNSSLNMMFDAVSQGMSHGFGAGPWTQEETVRFLCPSPGYDRHFSVTEYFGIELVMVDMTETGPDMAAVERLVKDPSVKGIWCVPKYSNPTGITYSDETVRRFAALQPAAPDFRIFWDNSYAVHDLDDHPDVLLPLLPECEKAGNADIALLFTSTSKISYSGAGVAAVAASEHNIALLNKRIRMQTIGPDKLNQLRHSRYFKDIDGIRRHMKKQAKKLHPKFEAVRTILHRELAGKGIATWTSPRGGYFISVDVLDGCAKRVVQLCKECGVTLTPAGATFPYGIDPRDRNIRIAPTFPPVDELEQAMEIFCLAVEIAGLECADDKEQ